MPENRPPVYDDPGTLEKERPCFGFGLTATVSRLTSRMAGFQTFWVRKDCEKTVGKEGQEWLARPKEWRFR